MSSSRLNHYKNKGKGVEDLRRQRSEASVELRKVKKEEQFLKRRNLVAPDADSKENDPVIKGEGVMMGEDEVVRTLTSGKVNDLELVFKAVQSVRRMLSRQRNPPIDRVIKLGLMPSLVTHLNSFNQPQIQFEAAWALTNIASGSSEQTRKVVKAGAVDSFIKLLSSNNLAVNEQAVWALGNIAGDGADLRDVVLKGGAMNALLNLLTPVIESNNLGFMRNLTWCISNLCRNRNPPPPFSSIQPCLPVLVKLLSCSDKEVVTDAAWALSYISDGTNELIQHVIESGAVTQLIGLLSSSEVCVLTPVVRAVGNVVTGSDQQTQYVLDSGVLSVFSELLKHPRVALQKEAVWMVSNITAGNPSQVQMVIDAGLIPIIISLLHNADFKVQKEAAWVLNNLIFGEVPQQITYCVQEGVVEGLCALLGSKDSRLLKVLLDCVTTIFRTAEGLGKAEEVCDLVESCGGLDRIEALQTHENQDIYHAAHTIIDTFYSVEGEEDNQLDSCKLNLQF